MVLETGGVLVSQRNTDPDLQDYRLAGRETCNKPSNDRNGGFPLHGAESSSATRMPTCSVWRPGPEGSQTASYAIQKKAV